MINQSKVALKPLIGKKETQESPCHIFASKTSMMSFNEYVNCCGRNITSLLLKLSIWMFLRDILIVEKSANRRYHIFASKNDTTLFQQPTTLDLSSRPHNILFNIIYIIRISGHTNSPDRMLQKQPPPIDFLSKYAQPCNMLILKKRVSKSSH